MLGRTFGHLTLLLFAVYAATASLRSFAVDTSFLRDSPIRELKTDDLKAYMGALDDVLEHAPDGATQRWSARASRFESTIRVLRSDDSGALRCRTLHIENDTGRRSAAGDYRLCKTSNGWRIASPESTSR